MRELVKERTEYGSVYEIGGGKRQLISHLDSPRHFLDGGLWRTIDFSKWERDGNVYRADAAPYIVEVGTDNYVVTYRSRNTGAWARARLLSADGECLRRATPDVDFCDGKLWWRNVVPGADIYFNIHIGGCGVIKVLYSADAPRNYIWAVEEHGELDFRVSDDGKGQDNFLGLELPERLTRANHRRNLDVRIEKEFTGENTYLLRERWTGKAKAIEPKTRLTKLVDEVVYPIWFHLSFGPQTITVVANDAHEIDDTSMSGASASYVYAGHNSVGQYNGAFRFTTVTIAAAATITVATLTLDVDTVPATALSIKGVLGDCDAWATTRPSQASLTTASVSTPGSTGSQAVTVTTIVQEIVDGTWVSGNNMGFVIEHDGSAATSYDRFVIDCVYPYGTHDPAIFAVTYEEGGGGISIPAVFHHRQRN